ncbi:hypothetical protein HMPREF0742_01541 [Rothia aeria F0184]|uniref:Uncharacterized protein n=1 Tax=Rothia aeria F0184 TaxID=888019 RepID=U7V442_9MICC|nr:hypothetical protein HMPREF0742_01541 [Rothia aeria F0184]
MFLSLTHYVVHHYFTVGLNAPHICYCPMLQHKKALYVNTAEFQTLDSHKEPF